MPSVRTRNTLHSLSVLAAVMLSASASARTWRVLRDGSGDFTTLLPACDAAAAGDTIWVGPGRYNECEVRPVSSVVSRPVCMLIQDENVTVVGAHRDSVVIGPDVRTVYTIGIAQYYLKGGGLSVSSISLVNFDHGVEASGNLSIRDVLFRDGGDAIWADYGTMTVQDSEFVNNRTGVVGHTSSHDLLVSSCVFRDNQSGCHFTHSPNVVVEHCSFFGGIATVAAFGSSTDLLLRNNSIEGAINVGVSVSGASLRAFDNSITGPGQAGVSLSSAALIEMRRNLISGTTWATIHVHGRWDEFLVKNNNFERGTGMLVRARNYSIEADSTSIDLSGNYWNTTDPDSLAAWIFDRNDDPAEFGRVIFEPFLEAPPVSAQKESMGGLKARFRRPQ